ncbi:hypothetical protein [Qipengyuania sp. 902]|uniref:hypothetical protein n=1 Tax=Qipengyuania sp. 902 TaxID=3417565 RepID=UPI003EBE7831
MKPIYALAAGAFALSFTIAACVPAPDSTPAPEQVATATPTPTPAPSATPLSPPPVEANWIDRPQTAGNWRYVSEPGETLAIFTDTAGEAQAVLSCRVGERVVGLARAGRATGSATVTIRTETASRTLAAQASGSAQPTTVATVQARDPLLDAIALTRGRFAMEMPGRPALYLPAWAEVTRVIEDCRR